jgi:PAS domain S-box-containing protein
MENENYKSILMQSPFGFAYHKIIVDKNDQPVDYEFLEVNPAFESITGLKAKDIIGKTVCQVLPGIRENDFDCVQFYGDIALNGGDGEFEQYSKQLGSWYKVQAYSGQKYYFSTVFTDITAQKSLSDIAAKFNNYSAQTINLQYLADKAREISGAAYVVLNKFDEDGRGSSTLVFSGMNKQIEKAISILGFDPRGKKWDYDPVRQKKIDNQKTTIFQQITDLTGTAIPPKIITLISKTLNIGQVAVVKTTRGTIMLGDFTLIFKRGSQLKNRETLETYADLTGMLLSRIDEERKVINEQARLKTITDNMTDLVWESDLQSINTYTSPSVKRILGFSVEEYMPRALEERIAPESLQTALSLLQEELEKENDPRVSKSRSRLIELDYYKKDGSIVPMESNISFVRDKNGKPVGLRGVSRDISERRQAEEALRENEEKYRALSEASFEAIFFSEKGICLGQNKNAEKLFGYTLSEAVGKSATDWIAPEYRQTVLDNILSGYEEPYEIRALRKDGSTFYAEMQGKMMHYQQRLVRVTALRDITGRRQAEEALRQSEEKLKSIFNNMTDVVWSISWPDLTHNYISPSLEKLYGRSKQELLDNPNLFQDITHPDDHQLTEKAMMQLLEEGKAERECRIIKPNGSIVWVNDRSKMIYDENQQPIRVDGVTRDITERKQAEEALRQSEKYSAFLSQTAFELVELNSIQEIYKYTVQKLYELFEGNSIVALAEFNHNTNRWKIQQTKGVGKRTAELSKLLGFDINNMEGEISTKYYKQLSSGKVVEIDFDLPGLFNNEIPASVGNAVKKMISAEKIYCIAYEQDDQILGNITLMTNKKSKPINTNLIEAFIQQVATIVKKQKAEEQLKESESFYKVTFEEAAVGVAHVLPNGDFFKVNNKFCDITGYDAAELTQMNIIDISFPEDTEKENEYIRQVLSKKIDSYIIEKRYLHKNRHWVWVRLHSNVVRNQFGEIEFAVASISDITQRKLAEESLKESEEKFKGVFEYANAGIAVADIVGKLIGANKEFENITGYSKAELMNMTVRDFTHPDDMNMENELIEKLFKSEIDNYRIEKRYIHKNGKVIWVDVSIAAMKNEKGEISHFTGMVKDITENVKATQALKESEEKHRQLLQQLHAGVVVHAADTSIRYANEQASQLLGLSIDQMMGKTAIDPAWHFVQEDSTPAPLNQYPVHCVIANKKPLREKVLGIHRPETNDLVWVLINAFPEFEPDGAIQQVVVTFIDITKRKQAEEALHLANDIVSNVQVGMYVYHLEDIDDDRTLRMISANPATEEITGVKVSDIIGKTLDENFPYLRDKGLPQRFAEVVRNGETHTFEDITYSDDRIMQACFSVKAFPLPHNHLGVAFENITEKVQAQNEIAESNSRLKMAQEIGNVGSWELDLLTNKVTWSDHTYAIYEQNPDSFEVNFENILIHYPEGEKERVLEALNQSISDKKNLLLEHKIITGKGNTRFVLESGRLILSDDGDPIKMIGSVADITQHNKNENELRESRNLFQQISLISKTGGWNVDLVTGEHNWTDVTREIHEVEPDFVPNMEIAMNFYEEGESRGKITQVVNRCIETGEPFDTEVQIITAKGNNRWVRSIGSGEFQDGKCVQLNGTIQDITERKKAEFQILKLSLAVDQSPACVVITNLEGTIEYVNPKFIELTGYTLEEAMGQNSSILKSGEHSEEFYKDLWDTISAGKAWKGEFRNKKKNGELYWESALISPIKNKKGEISNYLALKEDITERKRLENANQSLVSIIKYSQDFIGIAGKEKNAFFVNPAGQAMVGLEGDAESNRTSVDEYFLEEDLPYVKETILPALFSEGRWSGEFRFRHFKTGEAIPILYDLFLTEDPETGQPTNITTISRNITLLKQAEKELIKAKNKAEESDKLKTAFLNNISHEIRTPLNGILGFGGFLLETDPAPEDKKEMLALVEQASKRLMNTVADYVDMARIFSGTMEMHKKEFLLHPFLEDVTADTKQLCAGKPIKFTTDYQPDNNGLTLESDPELISRILNALLNNAMKFTAAGSICCGLKLKEGFVEFFVQDTGKGIASNKLAVIFNIFTQEDPSNTRGHEGSGLGLSIASGLVKLLGGSISVTSEKGVGSVFSFTIPHAATELAEKAPPAVEKREVVAGKPLVLIAEDEESNYLYMKLVLTKAGFDCLHAWNGEEALTLCKQHPEITLVLMDIKMPVMNGLEATKLIREFQPKLPIIATTAHAQTGDKQGFLNAGCDSYLAKPIKKEELMGLIQKYFKSKII